jgi:hypothetical protein
MYVYIIFTLSSSRHRLRWNVTCVCVLQPREGVYKNSRMQKGERDTRRVRKTVAASVSVSVIETFHNCVFRKLPLSDCLFFKVVTCVLLVWQIAILKCARPAGGQAAAWHIKMRKPLTHTHSSSQREPVTLLLTYVMLMCELFYVCVYIFVLFGSGAVLAPGTDNIYKAKPRVYVSLD